MGPADFFDRHLGSNTQNSELTKFQKDKKMSQEKKFNSKLIKLCFRFGYKPANRYTCIFKEQSHISDKKRSFSGFESQKAATTAPIYPYQQIFLNILSYKTRKTTAHNLLMAN